MAGKHGMRRVSKDGRAKDSSSSSGQHRSKNDPKLLPTNYRPKHRATSS